MPSSPWSFLLVLLCLLVIPGTAFLTRSISTSKRSQISLSVVSPLEALGDFHGTSSFLEALPLLPLMSGFPLEHSSLVLASASQIDASLVTVFNEALSSAVKGGKSGASAAVVQVLSLMWLRTAINYQYKYGTGTLEALRTLYKDGGIPRLYAGLPFALIQGPLSRFGDTASNSLVLSFWAYADTSDSLPVVAKTLLASVVAGGWRILITPVDSAKTILQVEGPTGLGILQERVKTEGPLTLYTGALAAAAATVVGHYPWFLTFNYLSSSLPTAEELRHLVELDSKLVDIIRSAFIGLCASSISDICSNSLRVLKTTRQSNSVTMSYQDMAKDIISKEGLAGLFGRGLKTRLFANALQGMLFTVLFKYFQDRN